MSYIRLEGMPDVCFAHIFGAEKYKNFFPKRNGFIEITYISAGRMHQICDGYDNIAEKGDFIINPYLTDFTAECDEFHEHHTVGFYVPFSYSENESDMLSFGQENEFSAVSKISDEILYFPICIKNREGTEECRVLLDAIIREKTMNSKKSVGYIGMLLELLDRLNTLNRSRNDKKYNASQLHLLHARQYIYDHIREPISQSAVAAFLGVTPEYLCALFKKGEGVPMMTYINKIKLENIRTAMEREKITLWRAAENYGYSDPNYVSRLYKKMYGVNITETEKQRIRR